MLVHVQDSGDYSFHVTNGVKQGCVLAPVLFSLILSAMLMDAFSNGAVGVGVRYRTYGGLFNLRRLKAKTMVEVDTARDLLSLATGRNSSEIKHLLCALCWIAVRHAAQHGPVLHGL